MVFQDPINIENFGRTPSHLECEGPMDVSWLSRENVPFVPWTFCSGKRKESKPKLFCPDIFGWAGGLPREGVGAKNSVCPSKPRGTKLFGGISRDFCRDISGVLSRTLKSTKIKEYLNQSFIGVLKCLHTIGVWASAPNIYHSMLSKK